MDSQQVKQCGKRENCVNGNDGWQPATLEYFWKNGSSTDGLQHWCKGCMNAYYAQKEGKSVIVNTNEVELPEAQPSPLGAGWWSTAEVAAFVGKPRSTLFTMARHGKFKAARFDKTYYVNAEVFRWIIRHFEQRKQEVTQQALPEPPKNDEMAILWMQHTYLELSRVLEGLRKSLESIGKLPPA